MANIFYNCVSLIDIVMVDYVEMVDEVVVELHWWDIFRFIAGTVFSYFSGAFMTKVAWLVHIKRLATWRYVILWLLFGVAAFVCVCIFYRFPDPVVQVGTFIWTMGWFLRGTYRR